MQFVELLVIAVGVSMDAFAVSICKGLSVEKVGPKQAMSVALWFGGFQALMPLLGYFLGVGFTSFVENIDHWIAFVLLGLIGANMIKESFSNTSREVDADFSFRKMLVMSIATSIDALAIGVSLAFLKVNIWQAVLLIGLITGAFSAVGLYIGNLFGSNYKSSAEFSGGIVLIIMGIKILVDHLCI